MHLSFFLNTIFLGIGLAMDALSVSVANTLREPMMKRGKAVAASALFGCFQCVMPIVGWALLKGAETLFSAIHSIIPYVALILLSCIGGKAVYESLKKNPSDSSAADVKQITFPVLFVQGIATSIDALSVGLTTDSYRFTQVLISAAIIGLITFSICLFGCFIGKKFSRYVGKAELIGGLILIAIGIEIFLKGILA